MDYYPSYHYGHFGPYERPRFQQFYQPPVFMVHTPVPPQSLTRNDYRTYDKDARKHFGKSKSSATKARDKFRKQRFIENKAVCSGLPFFGIDDEEFQKEVLIGTHVESREIKLELKLKTATEALKELRMENQSLHTTNEMLQRSQVGETSITGIVDSEVRSNEMCKLRDDLEFEKERVIKFVNQNVERQREINFLRNKLTETFEGFQSTIEKYQSIIDDYHRQTEQIEFLQKEKQQMQRIIDYLAKYEKDMSYPNA